eukprot:GILK01008074.1.p1 GENE.GILK01008074.1~~GILK01008074.1.p1  ORF type:complete len:274 (-),score=46.43 GILK01008074.1:241-1062(-)
MASPAPHEEAEEEVLLGKIDVYNGVIIDETKLPTDVQTFDRVLEASLIRWRADHRRGLWLKIPLASSNLISVAVKYGFKFHHAQPEYVMMTQWLAVEANKMPNYSSHYVGVGGVVINDRNEILLVQEVYADRPGRWKIPGGLADTGESIVEAAKREVLEETGIETEFVSVIAFREKPKYLWDRSDLYFVIRLRPLTHDITVEEREIQSARWIPLEEYWSNPDLYPTQIAISQILKADVTGRSTDWTDQAIPGPGNLRLYRSRLMDEISNATNL